MRIPLDFMYLHLAQMRHHLAETPRALPGMPVDRPGGAGRLFTDPLATLVEPFGGSDTATCCLLKRLQNTWIFLTFFDGIIEGNQGSVRTTWKNLRALTIGQGSECELGPASTADLAALAEHRRPPMVPAICAEILHALRRVFPTMRRVFPCAFRGARGPPRGASRRSTDVLAARLEPSGGSNPAP